MAIQIAITEETSSTGVICPAAYVRVQAAMFPPGSAAHVSVSIHKDAAARIAGKRPVEFRSYSLTEPLTDYSQAGIYAYLKTLPEYVGAVDV